MSGVRYIIVSEAEVFIIKLLFPFVFLRFSRKGQKLTEGSEIYQRGKFENEMFAGDNRYFNVFGCQLSLYSPRKSWSQAICLVLLSVFSGAW